MPKTGANNNMDPSMSIKQRVQALMEAYVSDPDYSGFDRQSLVAVTLISAQEGSVEYELTVTPNLCNKSGNLHGGAAATLLDNLTSMALMTIASHLDKSHVSRTLHTTYLRPVPNGTKVRIPCRVIAAGKNTANCYGEIQTLDGKACVTCVHDKAVFPSKL